MDFEYNERQKQIIRDVKEIAEEFKDVCYQAHQSNSLVSAEDEERIRQALEKRGLLGMTLPKELGGRGAPALDYLIALEYGARYARGQAFTRAMVNSGLGYVVQIAHYGTEEAKKRYLQDLIKGKKRIGLAMAEPVGGSALTDLITTAQLDGDHYILNGQKRWVGGGGVSDVYYTWVREPDTRGARGIFVVLVDKDSPGLSYGKDWGFWGEYHGERRDLIFKNCRVPRENLLLKPGQIRTAMMSHNTFRLQNAARTLGLAEGALDVAAEWSKKRKAFGKPLCEFQMIQGMLADMIMQVSAAQLVLYKAASRGTGEEAPRLETSIAKQYCNQIAVSVCDSACHILGAYGFVKESDTEWRYKVARTMVLAAGSPEMQKVGIVSQFLGRRFEQRLNVFNPDLYEEMTVPEL